MKKKPLPAPLFDWQPPLARAADPETSHEAAADAKMSASRGRILVLRSLAQSPATDFELETRTGRQQTSIGKRRGECMAAGLVCVQLDQRLEVVRRPTPSGSMARVWELTAAGRAYLEEPAK